MFPKDRCNLLDHEDEQNPRTKSEEEIVDLEEGVEALRVFILQEALNAKDDGEIRDEGGGDRRPGRERRDARLPAHIRFWQVEEDGCDDGKERVSDWGHIWDDGLYVACTDDESKRERTWIRARWATDRRAVDLGRAGTNVISFELRTWSSLCRSCVSGFGDVIELRDLDLWGLG